jgi:ABC-type polar amino acid transport system ATPase subunit
MPPIMLPTSALDPRWCEVLQVMKGLAREGMTMVVVREGYAARALAPGGRMKQASVGHAISS